MFLFKQIAFPGVCSAFYEHNLVQGLVPRAVQENWNWFSSQQSTVFLVGWVCKMTSQDCKWTATNLMGHTLEPLIFLIMGVLFYLNNSRTKWFFRNVLQLSWTAVSYTGIEQLYFRSWVIPFLKSCQKCSVYILMEISAWFQVSLHIKE